MRTLIVALALLSCVALADEYVAPSPTPADTGRYAVMHDGDSALRIDTMTGNTWFLCEKKKGPAWCRGKDISGLTSGPAGRYRLVDLGFVAMMDTVSGRTWKRCASPTGEKTVAWCPIEE